MAPPKFNINAKTITMPLAAFTMATIVFVYTRTAIQAAKRNAQMHREADGGQINWHNESLRRHGKLEPPEDQGTVEQLAGLARDNLNRVKVASKTETEEELRIKERAGRGKGSRE